MNKIYGNSQLINTLETMVKRDKTVNSMIFYGENGLGKKTITKYLTHLLLCENKQDGKPCFNCKACKNIEMNIHPDIIHVQKSGKLGRYSVETARFICSDVYIKPNNSNRKIYIFSDCHKIDTRTQNSLLKIIEEPPDYAHFIFTTDSRSNFLSTIISRCVCFGVSFCSEQDCKKALAKLDYPEYLIDEAVKAFNGNIGKCIDFLSDDKLKQTVQLTKALTDSIINKDEYTLSVLLNNLGKDRESVKSMLILLDKQIRDAMVLIQDKSAKTQGCYPDGALRLAENITVSECFKIHNHIEKAWKTIEFNVSLPLVMTALCCDIADTCL